MSAQLSYLDDTAKLEFESTIERIIEPGPKGTGLILVESWFYPQGGGQPSDRGLITGSNFRFSVNRVSLVRDEVIHYGKVIDGELQEGSQVTGKIDAGVRDLNSRLHSGGHVVMAAVDRLVGLPANKGYHFPDGPYVEFEGTLPPEDRPELLDRIQSEIDKIIAGSDTVTSVYESVDSLQSRGVHIPMEIPTNKPTRVVTMAGYDSPCGGTHVNKVDELTGLMVRKVKAKRGMTKVSYELS